jgi:hypothetical protein
MAQGTQARRLKQHIASLETMTRFVLATLALGSGVYTYLGVRSLLDGSATAVFFASVIYAVSVSVAIYGFWTYMIRFFRRCGMADRAWRCWASWRSARP